MNKSLSELGALPGMSNVKDQVREILQFHRISKLRSQHGLKTESHSNHMLFTGSPGTGKTTAARLIGEAFASMGILETSRDSEDIPFVEIHHADVTSKYVGQSEKIIVSKFEEARGGVVFIDGAYAFIDGESSHKSDDKVVATIVQLMEDMREEIIVIAAGYPKEMEAFLLMNPGLRSRFNTVVHFPDYSVPDMLKIAHKMLLDRDYQANDEYYQCLANSLWSEKDKPGFGNARTVRNIIEKSIRSQSVRVATLSNPNRVELMTLTKDDIKSDAQSLLSEKETLSRALRDIQNRLFDIELKGIISGKSTSQKEK